MSQCIYYSKGNTIHSSRKVENFKNFYEVKSITVGSKKYIITNNNFMTPVDIKNGIPCMPVCPCTDKECLVLPHENLTSNSDWEPSCLDSPGDAGNKS